MNRALMIPTLALVPLAASCSVAEAFGPRADATLVTLAHSAERDAESGSGPAAQLRAQQARGLNQEINRVCGLTPEGSTPESCAIPANELPAAGEVDLRAAAAALRDATPDAPKESRALLVSYATDLEAAYAAEHDDAALPAAPDLTDDAEAAAQARELLKFEYSTVWGLDFARAFLSGAEALALDGDIETHEEIIAALQTALKPTGEVPTAEVAYQPVEMKIPTTSAEANTFEDTLSQVAAQKWEKSSSATLEGISESNNPEWGSWKNEVAGRLKSRLQS